MSLLPKSGLVERLLWPFRPSSNREAGAAVVANFLLHWFPHRISKRSLGTSYSFYLGTISAFLLLVLTVSGVVLMFLYVPSVERAYWSIKDLEHAVSFGWLLRRIHRLAAHGMVAAVFLHMARVFFTGAYKAGRTVRSARPWNWVLGVGLFALTLLMSFTGYLLPWDQLALWAITVGTSIAAAVPGIGEELRQLLLGGTVVGQPTLIRFYVLHCALLPAVLFFAVALHMWRVRKDGGLAVVDQDRLERDSKPAPPPKKSKTYSVLGIASGTTMQIDNPTTLDENNSVPSSPFLTTRLLGVCLLTLAVLLALALFIPAPLEEPANPEVTPNPAKAPWYFLGLQEMVGYSALMGGVIIPGLVLVFLALIPWLDREQDGLGLWFTDRSGLRWSLGGAAYGAIATVAALATAVMLPTRELFSGIELALFFDLVNPATALLLAFVAAHLVVLQVTGSSRRAALFSFAAFVVAFVLLTYTGTALRGPNWDFYWPWEVWPAHPLPY